LRRRCSSHKSQVESHKSYEEIGKMLAGLIGHLEREDLKRSTRPPKPTKRRQDPANEL